MERSVAIWPSPRVDVWQTGVVVWSERYAQAALRRERSARETDVCSAGLWFGKAGAGEIGLSMEATHDFYLPAAFSGWPLGNGRFLPNEGAKECGGHSALSLIIDVCQRARVAAGFPHDKCRHRQCDLWESSRSRSPAPGPARTSAPAITDCDIRAGQGLGDDFMRHGMHPPSGGFPSHAKGFGVPPACPAARDSSSRHTAPRRSIYVRRRPASGPNTFHPGGRRFGRAQGKKFVPFMSR